MIVSRGIIYNKLSDDLTNIIKSFYCDLNDKNLVNKFENKFKYFNQSRYCLSYPFARSALWSILASSSLKENDEIILPAIQIKGMVEVCKFLKLKPVVVDIDQHNLSFNLKDLKKKITKKTKVILLTYLYGVVPDIGKILKIISKKKIILIEDFSQCLFGKYKNKLVGNFGDYGIYSLSATKTLDTYGGGLLVTNKKNNFLRNLSIRQENFKNYSRIFLIKKILLSLIRNFFILKINFFFVINIFKIFNLLGIESYKRFVGTRNNKLLKKSPKTWFQVYTSLQAVHGIKYINFVKRHNEIRVKNVEKLKRKIGKKYFCKKNKNSKDVYWQCAFFSNKYKKIQNDLLFKNIDVAQPSITLLPNVLNKKNFKAKSIYEKLILIPCYHSLKKIELDKIISTIKILCQK